MATPTKPLAFILPRRRLPSSLPYSSSSQPTGGISHLPGTTVSKRRRIDVGLLWQQARTTLKGQFIVLATVLLLLSVIEGLFISRSFHQAYNDLHTIGVDSIPSVDAAQAMAEYIQDIDAKSADYLAAAGLKN